MIFFVVFWRKFSWMTPMMWISCVNRQISSNRISIALSIFCFVYPQSWINILNWNWNTKTFFNNNYSINEFFYWSKVGLGANLVSCTNNNYSIIEYFSQARQQVPLHFINHQLQSIKYTTNSLVQVDANQVKELPFSILWMFKKIL